MTRKKKDIDYIFEKIVGGGGKWQWKLTLLWFPVSWIGGYPLFLDVYAAYTPPHRCFVPGCDSSASSFNATYLDFALPMEHATSEILREKAEFDPCNMYERTSNLDSCSAYDFDNSKKVACEKFVYDDSQMTRTLVTDLNIVCDRNSLKSHLTTVLLVGLFFGSFVGGRIGDRFGRKKGAFIAVAVLIPCVIVGGYISNYYVYLAFRFATGFALAVLWVNGHTFGIEYWSPGYRKLVVCIKDFPFSQFLLTALVYFNRDWTNLHLWTGIICLAGIPIWFLVPESPRWLAGNGRKNEALAIFKDAAKLNGKTLTEEQIKEIEEIMDNVDKTTEPSLNMLDLFTHGGVTKTLVLLLAWSTTCIGYYALTTSATKLSGDIVLNYFLLNVVDTPVSFLLFFTLDGLGRKVMLTFSQTLLGVCCVTLAFVPKTASTVILIVYVVGRAGSAMGFLMVYLVTAELYPTNLRTQAVGFCSMTSRVLCMSASYVTGLAAYWTPLPLLVLGVPAIVAGVLALTLTETRGKDLPQNLQEAHDLEEDSESTGNNNDVELSAAKCNN